MLKRLKMCPIICIFLIEFSDSPPPHVFLIFSGITSVSLARFCLSWTSLLSWNVWHDFFNQSVMFKCENVSTESEVEDFPAAVQRGEDVLERLKPVISIAPWDLQPVSAEPLLQENFAAHRAAGDSHLKPIHVLQEQNQGGAAAERLHRCTMNRAQRNLKYIKTIQLCFTNEIKNVSDIRSNYVSSKWNKSKLLIWDEQISIVWYFN